ncbi:MAG: FAD-dependent oxidoreductase [Flavobacteriales bacterium]|nr:FAD-dependent oxidoreductase [Flavobacteriales bacterium]
MSHPGACSPQPDTIIIGSGAGGLAAALCLARAGRKVLVLEQHTVPGGWCHASSSMGIASVRECITSARWARARHP